MYGIGSRLLVDIALLIFEIKTKTQFDMSFFFKKKKVTLFSIIHDSKKVEIAPTPTSKE